MKNIFYIILSFSALSLNSCNNTVEKEDDAPVEKPGEEYKLDVEKSQIRWFGEKIKNGKVDGSHNGTLQLKSGSINMDNSIITGGEFIINMQTIDEDGKDLDRDMTAKLVGHLKSEDFFETDKYPTASLKINSGTKESIQGTLTVKGVELEVDIPVTITFGDKNIIVGAVFDLDFTPFKIPALGGDGEYISNKIGFRVYLDFIK
jgi:polyisoprenoid-binding protein YceI